jgi:hypothetical protein
MSMENAIVAVYDSPASAALAVEGLKDAGYELARVSVASRDSGVEEGSACYYKDGAEVRYWGRMGGFWNRLLQVLPGWAFVPVTGVGPVVVAGPLARWVVAALENASIFSGLSAMGAGLYSIGISRDAIAEYEAALALGKCLVVAHGPAREIAGVRKLLRSTRTPARIGGKQAERAS